MWPLFSDTWKRVLHWLLPQRVSRILYNIPRKIFLHSRSNCVRSEKTKSLDRGVESKTLQIKQPPTSQTVTFYHIFFYQDVSAFHYSSIVAQLVQTGDTLFFMEAYYAFIGIKGQAHTLWALAADQYCIEHSEDHQYWIMNMRKSHVTLLFLWLPLSLLRYFSLTLSPPPPPHTQRLQRIQIIICLLM